jgi:plasmid replication initiation protein
MDITLFKPNELIAAIDQIQVNRIAKHLCNYFLQYAQYKLKTDKNQGHQFELPISELNAEAQIGLKDYKLIEKSLNALMQPVTIRDKDDPRSYIKLVPIYLVFVDANKGVYRFSLAPEVLDIIKNTDYFTKLNLHEFNFLESKHSLVLYEWLKRYETAPQIPELSIDELRNITHTADKKTYDNFSDLQKRVLDVAIKEISEKTPYTVTYEAIKTRIKYRPKVTAIQFHFTKKEIKKEAEKKPENAASISSAYEKLRSVCSGRYMTLKFYYEATYIYEPETLEVFADDCLAKSYHPNKTVFFKWLDERCSINQKGYHKQKYIYSEKFFRSVFCTTEEKYSMEVTMSSGEKIPAGFPEIIINVKEEYVAEAMKFYGKLPYNEYKHYLSDIWKRFEQQFNVNRDNVFE